MNASKRHPLVPTRSIIDFDVSVALAPVGMSHGCAQVAMLMQPMTLLGTIFGVTLNVVCPVQHLLE